MKVAVCEMTSVDSVEKNSAVLLQQLDHCIETGARFISFPENALYLRVDMQKGEKFAMSKDDAIFSELSKRAQDAKIVVHLGSVPLWRNGEIHNLTVWIDDRGEISFPYSKMHLFDIELEGKKPMRESDYYRHGGEPAIQEVEGFKFGLSICYDLRFAEMYSYYREQNVDALLIPSAFLVPTGTAHWEVLLRARAIENQCYVLAAAQGGEHISSSGYSRRTYGHSMIVDPWGEVLEVVAKDGESRIIFSEMRRDRIDRVRRQMPMHNHRRFRANWSWT